MMKNLLSLTKLLAVAALVVASTTNAFGYGNSKYNVFNTQVQTYPAGSGKVYVGEEECADPTADQYAESKVYQKVVYKSDSHSVKPFVQTGSDTKLLFAGWAKVDSLTNIAGDVAYWGFSSTEMNPEYLNISAVIDTCDTEDSANALLASDNCPKNYLLACYSAVTASMKEGYSTLGDVTLDKVMSSFGDDVLVKLDTRKTDVHVDYWLVNGDRVEATTGDSLQLTNVQEAKNVVLVPKSENLITVNFPEEGGYALVNIPGNSEGKIINYGMSGIRVDSTSCNYSQIYTGNTTTSYLAGGTGDGVTYLVYGKGTQQVYVYADDWQTSTKTYLQTAQKDTTINATDAICYTWNAATSQFDPMSGDSYSIKAGSAYLAIPAADVTDPTASIKLSEIQAGEFDFSKPAAYGYTEPTTETPTNVKDGETMTSPDGIVLTNVSNGTVHSFWSDITYYTKFYNENDTINLRAYNKTVMTVKAPEGQSIQKIVFTDKKGGNLGNAKTFDCGSYVLVNDYRGEWTGDDSEVTITNGGDLYMTKMQVTYAPASKVKYPEFSEKDLVLYDGISTPKKIYLTCATSGAEIKYTINSGDEETYDATEGIDVTSTCTITAWAVLEEAGESYESAKVKAKYTVNPVTKIATFNEFNALSDGDMVATTVALPVIYHWCTDYYNIFICSDGENVIYVNDKNFTISTQVPYGKKLAAGIAGLKHDAGYMSHTPDLQPLEGTVKVLDDDPVEITPSETTLTALAATPAYNKYLVLKGVKIAAYVNPSTGRAQANNYTISDATESTLRLFNRYSLSMTSLEDVYYDVKGILINNGTMDQFFPISIEKSPATAINNVDADNNSEAVYYNIQGIKTSAPQHGVFISNGKKVAVK